MLKLNIVFYAHNTGLPHGQEKLGNQEKSSKNGGFWKSQEIWQNFIKH